MLTELFSSFLSRQSQLDEINKDLKEPVRYNKLNRDVFLTFPTNENLSVVLVLKPIIYKVK